MRKILIAAAALSFPLAVSIPLTVQADELIVRGDRLFIHAEVNGRKAEAQSQVFGSHLRSSPGRSWTAPPESSQAVEDVVEARRADSTRASPASWPPDTPKARCFS